MSSGTRISQTPNLSFHRSSTPMPYSLGKPALNCCGGSLSTFGNMKRPDAARAAAHAAEKAPQDRPIHARLVSSGDVSSGSRPVAVATAGLAAVAALAAAPPGDAAFVVLPAKSGIGAAGGRGAAAGFACAAAAGAAGVAPVGGALGSTGLLSSAIVVCSHTLLEALHFLGAEHFQRLERCLA